MPRLQSLKHFFLMDKGDQFIHFIDLAENELKKNIRAISVEKLVNFLDISLKSSSLQGDPYKDDLGCSLTSYTNFEVLQAYQNYEAL